MSETIEPGTALAILPRASLPTILAADDKDIFGKLFAELSDFEPDVTTVKGRAEIASKAHKVATAKMDLIRLGKSLTEGWRKSTAAVNAECKVIEERMNVLRDKVRGPLDEYEAREARRVEAHEAAIREIELQPFRVDDFASSAQVREVIDFLDQLYIDRDWQEFATKASRMRQEVRDSLRVSYQTAKTREDEAEAARVAAEEEAERQRLAAIEAQRLREEQIAAEAAEQARIAAEEKAEREAREAEERAAAMLRAEQEAAAERERQAAAELARVEREKQEAIDKAERDRLAAIERQRVIEERERLAAEQAEAARIVAAQKAESDRLAAVEAERRRVAQEEAARKGEDDRRAADRAHRTKLNREIVADLMEYVEWPGGVAEALARNIVIALAKGEIRHTRITY